MSLYLTAARLIDASGGPVLKDAAVLVEDDLLAAVGPRGSVPRPASATEINLGDLTLLPGLIDMHAHLGVGSVTRPPPWIDATPVHTAIAVRNCSRALELGVTTVRDLGSVGDVGIAARWAVEAGQFRGPRILTARNIICMTGGHGSEGTPGLALEADGVDGVRRAVREQVKRGADLIKVATNGPLNIPEFSQEELDALVEEAHNDGRRVACHASLLESARRAIRAGVDTIEHGCDLDQASVELMAGQGITLVPTLLTHIRTMENWDRFKDHPMYKAIPIRQRQHRRSFELALSAGVGIAAGVDAGDDDILEFAAVAEEVQAMVDYGLTPMQGVESATRSAAEALGLADRLGTLAVGKWADLIAVEGDPAVDPQALRRVRLTIKAGKVEYRRE